MSDANFIAMPMMAGVPALIVPATSFVGGAPRQSSVAIGAGAAPGDSVAMFIGLTSNAGEMVIGVVPENFVEDLLALITDAARQVRERSYLVVDNRPSFQ